MNRRLWICLVMLTLVAAGFAGHASAQKPIKIGVLTPLSPPGDAGAGQLIVRGAKMAVEEINGRGERDTDDADPQPSLHHGLPRASV